MKQRPPSSPGSLAIVLVAASAVAFPALLQAQESQPDPAAAPAPEGEAPLAPANDDPTPPAESSTPETGSAASATASSPPEQTPAPSSESEVEPEPSPAVAPSAPPVAEAATEEAPSWFARPPLAMTVGDGEHELRVTLYGFLQTDFIYDTTRSYADAIGTTLVARTDTYDGTVSRFQASARNSRIGLMFEGEGMESLRPRAVLEADFFGNQPESPPDTSEAAFYDSATFRLRHAYFSLENDYLDVLIGQTYDVFGWQDYFSPTTAEFLGLPHQVFSRNPQLRLSQEFGESGPVGIDVAVAAMRPAQRDSGVPDANGGLRLKVNGYKGLRTSGNGSTSALPLALGVSGVVRHYRVDAFTPPPTQTSNSVTAWGVSLDALLPVISAADDDDRSNRLTLTGSFVTGTGIGDLMTTTGGAEFPTLPNPAQANPPPIYEGNIDEGLVSFDTQGVLYTIDWQAIRAGLVYYLPPSGRVFLSANYTQAYSKNMRDLFPQGGAEIELLTRVADRSRYADVNLFFDATPSVRLGIAGAYTEVEYIDGDKPHNYRGRFQGMYFF